MTALPIAASGARILIVMKLPFHAPGARRRGALAAALAAALVLAAPALAPAQTVHAPAPAGGGGAVYTASTLCQQEAPACAVTFPAQESVTLALDVAPRGTAGVKRLVLVTGPEIRDVQVDSGSATGTWRLTAHTVAGFRAFGTRWVSVIDSGGAVRERIPVQLVASAPRVTGVRVQRWGDSTATADTLTLAPLPASAPYVLAVRGGPFGPEARLTIEHEAFAVDSTPVAVTDSVAQFTVRVVPGRVPPLGPVYLRARADRAGVEAPRRALWVRLAEAPAFDAIPATAAVTANAQDQVVTLTGRSFAEGVGVRGPHVVGARWVSPGAIEVTLRVPPSAVTPGVATTRVTATNLDGRAATLELPIRGEPKTSVTLRPGSRVLYVGQPASVELQLPDGAPASHQFDGTRYDYEARFLDGTASAARVVEAGRGRLVLEGFVDRTPGADSVQRRRVEITATPKGGAPLPAVQWGATLTVVGLPEITARDSMVVVYVGDSTTITLQGQRLGGIALVPSRTDVVARVVETAPGLVRARVVAPVASAPGEMQLFVKRDDARVDAIPVRVATRPSMAGLEWRVDARRDGRFRPMTDGEEQPRWIDRRGTLEIVVPALPRGEAVQELVVTISDSTGAEHRRVRTFMTGRADTVRVTLGDRITGGNRVTVRVANARDDQLPAVERTLGVRRSAMEKWTVTGGLTVNRYGFGNAKAATLKDAFIGMGYSPDAFRGAVSVSGSFVTLQADAESYAPGAMVGLRFKTLFVGYGMAFRDLERRDPEGPAPSRQFIALGVAGQTALDQFFR